MCFLQPITFKQVPLNPEAIKITTKTKSFSRYRLKRWLKSPELLDIHEWEQDQIGYNISVATTVM